MWLLLTAVRHAEQAQAAAQLFKALCCTYIYQQLC